MDMEAGTAVIRLHHLLEGFVGNGEQGMPAEHGLDHVIAFLLRKGDEIRILTDRLLTLLLAVAL